MNERKTEYEALQEELKRLQATADEEAEAEAIVALAAGYLRLGLYHLRAGARTQADACFLKCYLICRAIGS